MNTKAIEEDKKVPLIAIELNEISFNFSTFFEKYGIIELLIVPIVIVKTLINCKIP